MDVERYVVPALVHRDASEKNAVTSQTSLGAGPQFPSTRWSRILAADEDRRRAAWESLASAYWKPVYAYVRARWARSNEDALDCTQDFFLWVMSSRFLERADPRRGRFRSFVKTALANFVRDLERKRHTLKRGGGRAPVALPESGEELPDVADRGPEEALDEAWRREVMERATRALEAELASQGKELSFRIFRDYFLGESELDYAAVAARYGVKTSDVSNHLQLAKQRFRGVLKATVADTVGERADLEAELAWLFGREGR